MGIFKLQGNTESPAPPDLDGREYFREAERELGIEDLDPAAVREQSEDSDLESGPATSQRGGDLSHHDLEQLDEAEIAKRRRQSEEFLKQEEEHFPAEEEQS
jgi:hypothetical protein